MILLSRLENEKLKDQILRGKKWLASHAQETGKETDLAGNPYNDQEWQGKLALYEQMVTEWRLRNLNDAEILEDEEIIENEKKRREELLEIIHALPQKNPNHGFIWKKWFDLREEGVKRNIFVKFIPTRLDREI